MRAMLYLAQSMRDSYYLPLDFARKLAIVHCVPRTTSSPRESGLLLCKWWWWFRELRTTMGDLLQSHLPFVIRQRIVYMSRARKHILRGAMVSGASDYLARSSGLDVLLNVYHSSLVRLVRIRMLFVCVYNIDNDLCLMNTPLQWKSGTFMLARNIITNESLQLLPV